MTNKTDKTPDDEASQWQQLTPAEINAIVKQAQARQPEQGEAEEGEPTRRARKPTKPAEVE